MLRQNASLQDKHQESAGWTGHFPWKILTSSPNWWKKFLHTTFQIYPASRTSIPLWENKGTDRRGLLAWNIFCLHPLEGLNTIPQSPCVLIAQMTLGPQRFTASGYSKSLKLAAWLTPMFAVLHYHWSVTFFDFFDSHIHVESHKYLHWAFRNALKRTG